MLVDTDVQQFVAFTRPWIVFPGLQSDAAAVMLPYTATESLTSPANERPMYLMPGCFFWLTLQVTVVEWPTMVPSAALQSAIHFTTPQIAFH